MPEPQFCESYLITPIEIQVPFIFACYFFNSNVRKICTTISKWNPILMLIGLFYNFCFKGGLSAIQKEVTQIFNETDGSFAWTADIMEAIFLLGMTLVWYAEF